MLSNDWIRSITMPIYKIRNKVNLTNIHSINFLSIISGFLDNSMGV